MSRAIVLLTQFQIVFIFVFHAIVSILLTLTVYCMQNDLHSTRIRDVCTIKPLSIHRCNMRDGRQTYYIVQCSLITIVQNAAHTKPSKVKHNKINDFI